MLQSGESIRFHHPEHEFKTIRVSHIEVEGADNQHVIYTLEEFCQTLPTAARLAESYGKWRVINLLSRQLELEFVDPYKRQLSQSRMDRVIRRMMQFNCLLTAANYVLGEGEPYNLPLPYSVALVLVSQLAYGVREKFSLPQYVTERIRSLPPSVPCHIPSTKIPVDATKFLYMDERRKYRDPSIPEARIDEIIRSGLVTLVGGNLLYMLENPWESTFILRAREVSIGSGKTVLKHSIPGGHAMNLDGLLQATILDSCGINGGLDNKGHYLIDVPCIREVMEETGLPLPVFITSRPLTLGDQVMRTRSGKPVRYLAYILQTSIWLHTLRLLRNEDGQGEWEWRIFGPGGDVNITRRDILEYYDVTPITQIAFRIFRE